MVVKRTLSLEQKQLLMGVAGFSLSSVFSYVPRAFKAKNDSNEYLFPKNLWTIYKLAPLTMGEYDKLQAIRKEEDSYASQVSEQILNDKIKGVVNFYDANGNELEYKDSNQIPVPVKIELIIALMTNAFLTDDELEGLDSLQG
jgi:hypothetical protein